MGPAGIWTVVLAMVGIGLALGRLQVAADPKPRPRLARWSGAGAVACFITAAVIACSPLIPGGVRWWSYGIGSGAVLLTLMEALRRELIELRRNRLANETSVQRANRHADRVLAVASKIGHYEIELDRLCTEAEGTGEEARLIKWKRRCQRMLDANLASDKATAFTELATERKNHEGGHRRDHLRSSCAAHHRFLQELLDDVVAGYEPVTEKEAPSGRGIPPIKSFIYRSE